MSQNSDFEDNLSQSGLLRALFAGVLTFFAWGLLRLFQMLELVDPVPALTVLWPTAGVVLLGLFVLLQFRRFCKPCTESVVQLLLLYLYALWLGWLLSFTPELRPALSTLFYAVLVFAMLTLPLASMLLYAGFCLVVYGGVVLYSIGYQNQLFNPAKELIQWLIMALMTLWLCFACGYLNRLREQSERRCRALKASRDRVETLGHFDDLTGLLKRSLLLKAMESEQNQVRQGRPPFALCLLDIDQFSYINEYYGYRVGDEVLRTLAELLKELLSGNELLARFNGEEFLLLLPETDAETAMARISYMRAQVAKHVFLSTNGSFSVCFSAGVSCYENHASVDDLLARVQQALGVAQNNQYNQSQFLPLNQPKLSE